VILPSSVRVAAVPPGLPESSKPAFEAPQLEGSRPRAIEPPGDAHLDITVSPERLAAILRHAANKQGPASE
jgi:hypothetical protein